MTVRPRERATCGRTERYFGPCPHLFPDYTWKFRLGTSPHQFYCPCGEPGVSRICWGNHGVARLWELLYEKILAPGAKKCLNIAW